MFRQKVIYAMLNDLTDMEVPYFLRPKDPMYPSGSMTYSCKRYSNTMYLTIVFEYNHTAFEYRVEEDFYINDDEETEHMVTVFKPYGLERYEKEENMDSENIINFILKDVKKLFDEHRIDDRLESEDDD